MRFSFGKWLEKIMEILPFIACFALINCKTFGELNDTFDLNENCLKEAITNIFDGNRTILYVFDDFNDDVVLDVNNARYLWSLKDVAKRRIYFNYRSYVFSMSGKNFFDVMQKLMDSIYWDPELSTSAIFLLKANEFALDCAKYLWNLHVIKVIFINDCCTTFTYDPFDEQHPKITHKTNDFFPFLRDMKKKTIEVEMLSSFLPIPYIDVEAKPPIGVVLNPLHLWSEKYNVTLKFYTRMDRLYSTGKFKEAHIYFVNSLRNGTIDILATYPTVVDFKSNFTTTRTFLSQKHLWVVTKAKRVSNTQVLRLIFAYEIWIYILLTVVLVAIIWYFINSLRKTRDKPRFVIEIVRVLLCGNTTIPRDPTLRILLLSFVIFAFLFNYTFQARYSSFLTIPQYEDKINTDEKLAKSNLIPNILDTYQYQFISWNNIYANRLLKRLILHNNPMKQVDYVYNHPKFAMMVLPMDSAITAVTLERVETFETQIVYSHDPRYILRFGSMYAESINKIASIVLEGGFAYKWSTDLKKIEFIEETEKNVSLTYVHVQFAFLALCGGLTLAVVTFCLEFLRFRWRK